MRFPNASTQTYSYDFVFGAEKGTKAVLDVHEIHGGLYGTRTIHAVLSLAEEAHGELKDRLGEELSFAGKLFKVDGMSTNVYIDEAKLV